MKRPVFIEVIIILDVSGILLRVIDRFLFFIIKTSDRFIFYVNIPVLVIVTARIEAECNFRFISDK